MPHNSNNGPFVEETPMCRQADSTKTHHLSSSLSSERAVIPDCPDYLDAVAKAKWAELCEVLGEIGLLSSADRDVMALYCCAYSLWREAEGMIKKSGLIIKTPGGVGANPCVEIAANSKREMLHLSALLGLDPTSRGQFRVGVSERTVYRRQDNPAFRKKVRTLRAKIIDQVLGRMADQPARGRLLV